MTRKPPIKTFNKVARKALDNIIRNKEYHQASPTEKMKMLQKEIDRLHKREEVEGQSKKNTSLITGP